MRSGQHHSPLSTRSDLLKLGLFISWSVYSFSVLSIRFLQVFPNVLKLNLTPTTPTTGLETLSARKTFHSRVLYNQFSSILLPGRHLRVSAHTVKSATHPLAITENISQPKLIVGNNTEKISIAPA